MLFTCAFLRTVANVQNALLLNDRKETTVWLSNLDPFVSTLSIISLATQESGIPKKSGSIN